jgi:hypothetical protein
MDMSGHVVINSMCFSDLITNPHASLDSIAIKSIHPDFGSEQKGEMANRWSSPTLVI